MEIVDKLRAEALRQLCDHTDTLLEAEKYTADIQMPRTDLSDAAFSMAGFERDSLPITT